MNFNEWSSNYKFGYLLWTAWVKVCNKIKLANMKKLYFLLSFFIGPIL